MSDDAPGLSLLPPNRSLLEAGLDLAFAKLLERIEPPFPALMDPATAPVDFLPYLAADRGVGEWDSAGQEAEKRATVAGDWAIKRLAGTRRALEIAVEGMQLRPQIIAWHERSPLGTPYTFEVVAWADRPFDQVTNDRLDRRLEAAKSERDVLTTRIGLSTTSKAYVAASMLCGEVTTIYPLQATELEQSNLVYLAAALVTVEKTTIYPLEA